MTTSNEPTFKMTVDLNVLDHLADGLYSSVAAVITETVANSWDADAKKVRITLDVANDNIQINDDGHGMNVDDVNECYLKVGFKRREQGGDTTPDGRTVMGRKGIGKLSLYSIAETIEVHTKKMETDAIGLKILSSELRSAMAGSSTEYMPDSVHVQNEVFHEGKGTVIALTSLKMERLREMAPESLRRRLARRFSVIGSDDFKVYVNDAEVTAADREDLKNVEYLWKFGDTTINTEQCTVLKEEASIPASPDSGEWSVRGWIGTVDNSRKLATREGNLNSIIVLSRGRLVDEDILPRISGAEVYTKYITGQIEADFLDSTDAPDIVTSNRQRVIEDDERMTQLVDFLKKSIRITANKWTSLRARDKTSELHGNYPKIATWVDSLESGWKTKASKLLERIATMEIGKEEDEEDNRKTLLQHAIYGFERLRLRGDAEELEKALSEGTDSLLRLLADRDSLEASLYREIVSNRLEVIEKFESLAEDDPKERVLQLYLFDHLWLLDPAWERATGSVSMEERLKLIPEFKDDETTKDKFGRVDIKYRTVMGKHVIVELKRVSVKPGITTLAEQGSKYVDALKVLLPVEERMHAHIEVVFVVGYDPPGSPDRIDNFMRGVSAGSRIMTYDQLIARAMAAYSEFIMKTKETDKIEHLFDMD